MFSSNDQDNDARLTKAFWKAIDDSPFMMLGLSGVADDQTCPMTAQVDVPAGGHEEDGGPIYFFASKSDGVGRNLAGSPRAVAAYAAKGHSLFAHVHGTLSPSNDRAVIDRLWNPFVASWYNEGKDDPDLLLLRFDTERATIWEAEEGSTLKAAALRALFKVDPGKERGKEHKADVTL